MNAFDQEQVEPPASKGPWIGMALLGGGAAVALSIIVGLQMRRIATLEGQIAEAHRAFEERFAAPPSSTSAVHETEGTKDQPRDATFMPAAHDAASPVTGQSNEPPAATTDWNAWLAHGDAMIAAYEQAPNPTLRAELTAMLDAYAQRSEVEGASRAAHRLALRLALNVRPDAMDRPISACIQSDEALDPELLRRAIREFMRRPVAATNLLTELEARLSRASTTPADRLLDAAVLWRLGRAGDAYDVLDRTISALTAAPDRGVADIVAFRPGQVEYPFAQRALAAMLASEGQLREAVKTWRAVLAASPEDARGWDRLGSMLSDMLEEGEAEAAFRKALELDDTLSYARLHLGIVLMNQEKLADAMVELDAAIAHASVPMQAASARFAKAVGLARSGRLTAAETELKRALALDPSLAQQAAEVPAFKPLLETGR